MRVNTPERTPYAFDGGRISISDADVDRGELQVRLSMLQQGAWWGSFTLAGTAGLTLVEGDGVADEAVTFRGTLYAINAALDGVSFLSGFSSGGYQSFAVDVDDLGSTGPGGSRTVRRLVGVSIGQMWPMIRVLMPPPHTPQNTAYVSDGQLLSVEDWNDDVLDVRVTVDRGTVDLGAAPDATVLDAGGDGDAHVIGRPVEIRPALDGLVVTPAHDDTQRIVGLLSIREPTGTYDQRFEVWVGAAAPAPPPGDDQSRPLPSRGIEDVRRPGETAGHPRPIARVSASRVGRRVKLDGRGSGVRGAKIRSYRWTSAGGRVLSRHAAFSRAFKRATRVTLTVVDSRGLTARASVVVKPSAAATEAATR